MEPSISPDARLLGEVSVGQGTRIHPNVEVRDGSRIGDHCVIGAPAGGRWAGRPVVIGEGSVIRSHTVVYEGSSFGDRLETGHHVLIREGTQAGTNLRVGSFSDLEGDCEIGDYCRFHSYVHVGRGSRIGSFVWLYSQTTLTNDPLPPSHVSSPVTIEDGVVVCVGGIILAGARLGIGSFVASGSRVGGCVSPGMVVDGRRGDPVAHVTALASLEHRIRHPWMSHFADAYPEEAQPRLQRLLEDVRASRKAPIRPKSQ